MTTTEERGLLAPAAAAAMVPFEYGEVALKEACWIEGEPYFTRRAIGEWLGYANPRGSITKIIERNPHIRDSRWSVDVSLTSVEGGRKRATDVSLTSVEGGREVTRSIEVYNPIGLQLIVFESRKPRAIAYKIAVAHLVVAWKMGELAVLEHRHLLDEVSALEELLEELVEEQVLVRAHIRGKLVEYSRKTGRRIRRIKGELRERREAGLHTDIVAPERQLAAAAGLGDEEWVTVEQVRELTGARGDTIRTRARRQGWPYKEQPAPGGGWPTQLYPGGVVRRSIEERPFRSYAG